MGPYGSGKTTGCIMELMRRATEEYPDANGIIKTRFVVVRNTAQQLRQTILEEIRKWFGRSGAMHYAVTDSTVQFRFRFGKYSVESDWLLIPLDKPEDVQRLLSLNITGGWVSEFREVPIPIVEALLGRCGRFRPLGVKKNAWHGVIAESNPPDEDSDWYMKMEVDKPNNWAVFKQPGGLDPAAENRENLRDGYYESLMESNSEDWVDVHVHAKYGKSLSGQAVFRRSFRSDFHVARKPLVTSTAYQLMIGQDFGRTPASLIGQVDNRGRLIIVGEATSEDMGIEQFATSILRPMLVERFPGYSTYIVCDPAGRQKTQLNEESPIDGLKRMGFRVYPSVTNDLDPRLRAVDQLLLRQVDGGPLLIIDAEHCPQLLQALKFHYRYKRKKAGDLEDTPEKKHPWSDLADCLQYMALAVNANYTGRIMAEGKNRVAGPKPTAAGWT
jgi:hypothetical protein